MKAAERVKVTLRELERERQAVDGLRVQIEEIEADDRQRAAEKQALERRWRAKRNHVAHVDRVLASLSEQERDILQHFYCQRLKPGEACNRLERRWNISQSEVYRQREKLLAECAVRMGYA